MCSEERNAKQKLVQAKNIKKNLNNELKIKPWGISCKPRNVNYRMKL